MEREASSSALFTFSREFLLKGKDQYHLTNMFMMQATDLFPLTLVMTAKWAIMSRILNQMPMFSARSATARLFQRQGC
jgi:hypothetical protein